MTDTTTITIVTSATTVSVTGSHWAWSRPDSGADELHVYDGDDTVATVHGKEFIAVFRDDSAVSPDAITHQ